MADDMDEKGPFLPNRISSSTARSSTAVELPDQATLAGKGHYADDVSVFDLDPQRRLSYDAANRTTRWRRTPFWLRILVIALGLVSTAAGLLLILRIFSVQVDVSTAHALPPKPIRKALVMSRTKERDMSWTKQVSPDWEIYDYVVDDPHAPLTIPRNEGREAMTYLTYLVDHYDDLPDYVVFTHGHYTAWHQEQPIPMLLAAMDFNVVDQQGWMSLRCTIFGRCEGMDSHWNPNNNIGKHIGPKQIMRKLHAYVYRKDDPWYEPLPEDFAASCCAQFVVSKKQIQTKPHEFWKRLRAPILAGIAREYMEEEGVDQAKKADWRVGNAFELTWHWYFGKPPVTCYEEDFCNKQLFQGKIHCNGTTSSFYESRKIYGFIECTLNNETST